MRQRQVRQKRQREQRQREQRQREQRQRKQRKREQRQIQHHNDSTHEYTKYYGELDSNGLAHGKGTFIDQYGNKYEGSWKHGNRNGYGIQNKLSYERYAYYGFFSNLKAFGARRWNFLFKTPMALYATRVGGRSDRGRCRLLYTYESLKLVPSSSCIDSLLDLLIP